jgi:hypothetical protein
MPRIRIDKADILSKIDTGAFDIVGCGAYGVVITLQSHNHRLAVKVGSIPVQEWNDRRMLMKARIAVPHYAIWREHIIPDSWYDVFGTWEKAGYYRDLSRYTRRSENDDSIMIADIMIMAVAQPIIDGMEYGDSDSDDYPMARVNRAVSRLKAKAYDRCGYWWGDSHDGNIGVFNGYYVILDPSVN